MNSITDMVKVLFAFIVSIVIPYIGFSFIEWSANPKDWSLVSRVISFILSYSIFILNVKELLKKRN